MGWREPEAFILFAKKLSPLWHITLKEFKIFIYIESESFWLRIQLLEIIKKLPIHVSVAPEAWKTHSSWVKTIKNVGVQSFGYC